MSRKPKVLTLYDRAKKESNDQKWSRYLINIRRRVCFEDGYVQGWLHCEEYMKKKRKNAT